MSIDCRKCRTQDECRDAGLQAVARLSAGETIGIATKSGYVAVARDPANFDSVDDSSAVLTLGLRHADELYDFHPDLPRKAFRLLSRCESGSLILQLNDAHGDSTSRITITSGPLAEYVHPYAAWPLFLLQASPSQGENRTDAGESADSLVDWLPNCLNYVVDSGLVDGRIPVETVECSEQGVTVIAASEMSDSAILERGRMGILFVCTGNTCRSPMAEAICRKMLADRLGCEPMEVASRGVEISSAGLAADYGHAASPQAVELLAEEGIDLSLHQSQPLTSSLLEQSERVYALTKQHRQVILTHRPELHEHIFLLSQNGQDVSDPIGGDHNVYRECKQEIEQYLKPIVDQICDELDSSSD